MVLASNLKWVDPSPRPSSPFGGERESQIAPQTHDRHAGAKWEGRRVAVPICAHPWAKNLGFKGI